MNLRFQEIVTVRESMAGLELVSPQTPLANSCQTIKKGALTFGQSSAKA
jgi:hypothetical protein